MFKLFGDWYITFVVVCFGFLLLYGIIRVLGKRKGSWATSLNESHIIPSPAPLTDSNQSVGEARARQFLETYFGKKFIRVRPDFLSNSVTGGRNLELDCYNEELKLAVEYNGRQHYEFVPYYHKNKESFYNQKYRDELKRIYCRDSGIILIEVPYTETKYIETFLNGKLKNLDLNK